MAIEVVTTETYKIFRNVPRVDEDKQPVINDETGMQFIDVEEVETYTWKSAPPTPPIGARVMSLTFETGLVHYAEFVEAHQAEEDVE